MAFSDPQILCWFLKDYLDLRASLWSNTANQVKDAAMETYTQVRSVVFNMFPSLSSSASSSSAPAYESDKKVRESICAEYEKKFRAAQTLAEWVTIMYSLGELGREIQKNKKPSWFVEVLNAIRVYIYDDIKNEPGFSLIKEELLKQKNDLKTKIDIAEHNNEDVTDLDAEYDTLLKKLSDLNDEKSILEARRRHLFPNFEFPPTLESHKLGHRLTVGPSLIPHIHRPYCYQEKWYEAYYLKRVSASGKREDYLAFLKRAKEIPVTLKTQDSSVEAPSEPISSSGSPSGQGAGGKKEEPTTQSGSTPLLPSATSSQEPGSLPAGSSGSASTQGTEAEQREPTNQSGSTPLAPSSTSSQEPSSLSAASSSNPALPSRESNKRQSESGTKEGSGSLERPSNPKRPSSPAASGLYSAVAAGGGKKGKQKGQQHPLQTNVETRTHSPH